MAASNAPSAHVAERLGMRLEARFRNPRNRDLETLVYLSAPAARTFEGER
jgi:RimJ/RimL family protein N-acetyltransferase